VVSRGDIVVVSAPGDFGKPRPAVVVQTNFLNPTHASIIVCLVTSDRVDAPLFRIPLEPGPATGLKARSQVMVDKVVALGRHRLSAPIGKVDDETLLAINRALALVLGLVD
jgi:mRNA interferase MazF